MALNLTILAGELQADPRGYGYAPLIASGDDTGLATLLNKPRDGTDGFLPAISVRKTDIQTSDLVEAIDVADLSGATAGQAAWLQMLSNAPIIQFINPDGSNTRVLTNLRTILPSGGAGSRGRINNLANRVGSRAEELFGSGIVITDLNIAHALRPVQTLKA